MYNKLKSGRKEEGRKTNERMQGAKYGEKKVHERILGTGQVDESGKEGGRGNIHGTD